MAALLDDLSLREFFTHSRDAMIVVDADVGLILEANPAACTLTGHSGGTIQGIPLRDLFQDHHAVGDLRAAFPDKGSACDPKVVEVLRVDGERVTCEFTGWYSEHSDGPFFCAVLRDISDHVRTRQELRLRNVAIASVHSGVAMVDARQPDLPLIYVNRGFETITGYSWEEVIGRNCRFLHAEDNRQPELDRLRNALREGKACVVRLRNYRKDGKAFWNELHISPVRDEEGSLTHFVGIQIDVTERVESRQRLEESERRYRTLAESIEDVIVRSSATGAVQFISSSLWSMLGWEPRTWIDGDFASWIHPEDLASRRNALARCEPGNDSVTHSFRLRHSNGDYIWVEATETLIMPPDAESHFVSVIRDISLRRKAEEDIRMSLERERELHQIKNSFIRMVSHEFRTPMTGIGASTAFLRAYAEELPEEKRERHFDNIERSLHRMNRLLDDVLFVSRSATERINCGLEPVSLVDFCERLIDETTGSYPGRTVELRTRIQRSSVYQLDPHLLHHIFQNLLGNALKYSPPHEQVEMEVIDDAASGRLLWRVTDRGIGIPEADQPSLFEPFQRAANVGATNGTGLGLFIAKRSAELHGGEIVFSSAEQVGSEFCLSLPRIVSAATQHA